MCPEYCENLQGCYHVFGTRSTTKTPVVFYHTLKRRLSTELPSEAAAASIAWSVWLLLPFSASLVSGSCTHAHWPRSKLSLQRSPSNLSQRWMMWKCCLQSPRCFQSAGLLFLLFLLYFFLHTLRALCEVKVKPSNTGNATTGILNLSCLIL